VRRSLDLAYDAVADPAAREKHLRDAAKIIREAAKALQAAQKQKGRQPRRGRKMMTQAEIIEKTEEATARLAELARELLPGDPWPQIVALHHAELGLEAQAERERKARDERTRVVDHWRGLKPRRGPVGETR
jgi:alkanesulfonate monooxygenase SsuD/methylene tetrahydromethanopterin reductase-like flavin-dependent oxidoreductase (luciferase family)